MISRLRRQSREARTEHDPHNQFRARPPKRSVRHDRVRRRRLPLQDGSADGRRTGEMCARQNAYRRNHFATALRQNRLCPFRRARRRIVSRSRALLMNQVANAHESCATGHLEFAKDGVQMLFHHRQTQPGVLGDLLVASALGRLVAQLPVRALSARQEPANPNSLASDRAVSGQRFSHPIRKCGRATPADLSCFS